MTSNRKGTGKPTIKAVLDYAEKMAEAAHKLMDRDYYAKPWYPTTAGAREQFRRELVQVKLDFQDDPESQPADDELEAEAARRAIAWMQRRAARDELERREHETNAKRSQQRHQRRSREARRDREATRAQRSPGQRIDAALASLATIGTVRASLLDADKISGSPEHSEPRFPGDPAGKARHKVFETVRFVENELEEARRRCVELERDVA